jgi:hypothetical protein
MNQAKRIVPLPVLKPYLKNRRSIPVAPVVPASSRN